MRFNSFSKWKKWDKREDFNGLDYPGVYALAISAKDLSGKPFSLIKQIVYFGMTNSGNGLRGRLKQFDNTIAGKIGHGGAERFMHKWSRTTLKKRLYVSINFIKCDVRSNKPQDLLKMGDVARFEYTCFAAYTKKFREGLPEFNDKKRSPKGK